MQVEVEVEVIQPAGDAGGLVVEGGGGTMVHQLAAELYNTGGGGGGDIIQQCNRWTGGSGVVVIRYKFQ